MDITHVGFRRVRGKGVDGGRGEECLSSLSVHSDTGALSSTWSPLRWSLLFQAGRTSSQKGGGCIRPYPFLVKTPLLELQYIRFNSYINMQLWCTGIVKLYIMSCVAALYYHQIRLEDKRNMPNEPFSNPLSRRWRRERSVTVVTSIPKLYQPRCAYRDLGKRS